MSKLERIIGDADKAEVYRAQALKIAETARAAFPTDRVLADAIAAITAEKN